MSERTKTLQSTAEISEQILGRKIRNLAQNMEVCSTMHSALLALLRAVRIH